MGGNRCWLLATMALGCACAAPDELIGVIDAGTLGSTATSGASLPTGGPSSSGAGDTGSSGSGGPTEADCSFFASAQGGADGATVDSPATVADFWAVAQPGAVLCLLDGVYRGPESMVAPPSGLAGMPGVPITVRALNDGGPVIDGEFERIPVRLEGNHHFVVEGIDAHASSGSVVHLNDSLDVVVRRVVAWDGLDPANTHIVGCFGDGTAVLEDIAIFGTGRTSLNAHCLETVVRRAWARWEGSHYVGPKATYRLHGGTRCEDCIGTWDGLAMQESYVLECPEEATYAACGTVHDNHAVDQPYGVFYLQDDDARVPPVELAGAIAYQTHTQRIAPLTALVFALGLPDAPGSLQDVVGYRDPDLGGTVGRTFNVTNFMGGPVVAIGGVAPDGETEPVTPDAVTPLHVAPDLNTAGDVFGLVDLCHRHDETKTPLWPWPMDERIEAALVRAGRSPLRVTEEIVELFGPIPDDCLL